MHTRTGAADVQNTARPEAAEHVIYAAYCITLIAVYVKVLRSQRG
jgi:hypothetical protein